MAAVASTRMPFALSSLELMLEEIRRDEEVEHGDVPPALPARPVTRARLPRSRARLLFASEYMKGCEDYEDEVGSMESRKSENDVAEKPVKFNDGKEASVPEISGIQNHVDQLDEGVIALQSFIRGANARKYFAKKMAAIEVIQKHLKSQLKRSRLLEEEDEAVIYLQESIRGWLAWQHLSSMDQREKQFSDLNMKSFELKDKQVQVPYSVLVDLQRRVLKTEALLDEKKEENDTLKLQMKQLERQRQHFETRMKSMEKTWQDQLTALQASLAADKKGSSPRHSAGKLGMLFSLPEDHDEGGQDSPLTNITSRLSSDRIEFDDHHQNAMSRENVGVAEMAPNDPEVEAELRKLKLRFRTWKRDFKTRLVFAKTKVKKAGNSEGGERISCHKKWWGRK